MLMPTLVAAALLASSGGDTQPASVRVSYADLDLSRSLDRAELDHRLVKAARQVCRRENGPSSDFSVQLACERHSLAEARGKAARVLLALQARGVQLAEK